MQPPQKLQPVRLGPLPSKYGSGTVCSSAPKKTPTSVARKVFSWPRSAAISRSTSSAFIRRGLRVAPSILRAVS